MSIWSGLLAALRVDGIGVHYLLPPFVGLEALEAGADVEEGGGFGHI